MNLTNARLSYEPQRGNGAICVYFKDRMEAVGFAEAILQEVRSIENDGLSVPECALLTIELTGEQIALRDLFDKGRNAFIAVPDRG